MVSKYDKSSMRRELIYVRPLDRSPFPKLAKDLRHRILRKQVLRTNPSGCSFSCRTPGFDRAAVLAGGLLGTKNAIRVSPDRHGRLRARSRNELSFWAGYRAGAVNKTTDWR